VHKSVFEYFMAKRLINTQRQWESNRRGDKATNIRAIQEEKGVLEFWEEGWQEKESRELKEPLFTVYQEQI
jgi:hypothetical protein